MAKLVNCFLAVDIDVEFPLWLVWLSQASPLDATPAHLGAALEALRKAYCEGSKSLKTKLLPDQDWKDVHEKTSEALASATKDLPKELAGAVQMLKNKLQQLNTKSSNMQYSEFFDVLGLPTGLVEKEALRERNRPAHGHKYDPGQYGSLAATADALLTLFWRVMLKITGAADTYIDYSTYGHPQRQLQEPLGGPAGDGRPAKV